MRQIWAICAFELQRTFKQRRNWILMIAMPLLFSFIFGSFTGKSADTKIPLAVSDEDHTLVSQALVDRLSQNKLYTVKTMSEADADARVHDKEVAGMIVIPQGYMQHLADGSRANVTFRHGPDLSTAQMIKQDLNNAMAQTAVQVTAAKSYSAASDDLNWQAEYQKIVKAGQQDAITVHVQVVTKTTAQPVAPPQIDPNSRQSIGFSMMFVMISLIGATGKILEARRTGVWYRLLSTPVTRVQVLSGFMLSFFLIGWIQFGLLMGLTSLLFGVQWGNLLGVIVLVSALLLSVVGLGLFLAGLVKSSEQQSALGSIVIVSTCMLGGVYWPLDIVSTTMRRIAEFVPQSWAMQGFTELVARGGTISDIWEPIAVLLGFAIVFLAAGVSRVRYE